MCNLWENLLNFIHLTNPQHTMTQPLKRLAVILFCGLFIHTCFAQVSKEKISLISKGSSLNAFFYGHTGNEEKPTVILLHGLPGNDDNPLNLAENLNKTGLNILVFNYRGSYSSEGYFSNFNCMDDLDAAIGWLKTPANMSKYGIDTSRIVVCGYSFGGCIVLTRALTNPAIRIIVSVSGLDQSVSLKQIATDSVLQAAFESRAGALMAPAGPIKFNPDKSFHEQVNYMISRRDEFDLVKYADKLKDRKILFITGWFDMATLMEENALPLYRKLHSLGSTGISIEAFNTTHRYTEVRPELADSIAKWIERL